MVSDVSIFFPKQFRCLTLQDYVGLEVHDVGDGSDRLNLLSGHRSPSPCIAAYSKNNSVPVTTGTVLLPNMVITIEPGM
jgi:Xaa-Pro dipeptidase